MRRPPRWLQALGNTGDGVFVADAAQRIIYWNKGAEDLLGYSAAEVLHRHCYDVIGGRLRSGRARCRKNCNVQRAVRRGTPVHNFDLLTSTKQGQDLWVNVSIIALPRKDKRLTLHLLRDITRQERGEEVMDQILRLLRARGVFRGTGDKGRGARPRSASSPNRLSALSERESEVLRLLSRGLSTQAIAARLAISPFTVRNHVRSILKKTGFHSKTAVVSFALRNGLF